jgi:hypothetical protein
VKEQRHIVTSNYLEAGVPDAVNLADKPIMNADDTTGAEPNRPQRIANVNSFSRIVQYAHASQAC